MPSRGLPPLLSLVEFEPLADSLGHNGSSGAELAHGSNPLHFKQRVEQLASEYLSGQPLFILSATLQGPFHSPWINPWATEPLPDFQSDLHKRPVVYPRGDALQRGIKRLKPSPPRSTTNLHFPFGHKHEAPEPLRNLLLAPTPQGDDAHNASNRHDDLLISAATLHSPIRFTPANQGLIHGTPSHHESKAARVTIDPTPHLLVQDTAIDSANVNSETTKQSHSVKDQIVEHAMRSTADPVARRCSDCGNVSAKQWRKGPRGPNTLCGVCYRRRLKNKSHGVASISSRTRSKPSAKRSKAAVALPIEQQSAPHNISGVGEAIQFPPIALPDPGQSSKSLPLRNRFFSSQPQPIHDRISFGQPMQRSSSYPQNANSSKPCHSEVMESLFPGGLITDAFRRHGQLIDLMQENATARLNDILRPGAIAPDPDSAIPAKAAVKKTRSRRKARAMTFETPVITHVSKKARNPSNHSQINNVAATDMASLAQDKPISPLISTQAALIEAQSAFFDGFDSPPKPDAPKAEQPRLALQDKTNISAAVSPAKTVNDIKPALTVTHLDKNTSPSENTQALFDAAFSYSLTSSPAFSSTSPINANQNNNKRASFASEPMILKSPAKTPSSLISSSNSSRALKIDSSGSLRKSALKKSSSQAAHSLDSPTRSDSLHDTRTPTHVFSAFAAASGHGGQNDGAEGAGDVVVDSFCQDANSLLQSLMSP